MQRILIEKIKVKGTRGYRYKLKCNKCGIIFPLGGNNFNKGKGYFCSRKCRMTHPEERKKNSRRVKLQFQRGRIHPKGMLGKIAWNKGKESLRWKREKNPNWNNGSSYEEYGFDWIKKLKEKIRKRDGYECIECNEQKKILVVHHIDYNKKNNKEENLITLCRRCHGKTNYKREDWTKYFRKALKEL